MIGMKAIKINPLNSNSAWGALEIDSNELICEGIEPRKVREKADKTGKKYIMMFLFPGEANYIF